MTVTDITPPDGTWNLELPSDAENAILWDNQAKGTVVAMRWGISTALVSLIRTRKVWGHV